MSELIMNDTEEELVITAEMMEPHQLVHTLGWIPRDLGIAIDTYAPLFPFSYCVERYYDNPKIETELDQILGEKEGVVAISDRWLGCGSE
mgnify:CR=1 FL=1